MADTDEEQQQTGQTITPPQERLVDLLTQLRETRRAYDASEISVDVFYDKVFDIDRRMTLRLADNFNLRSGIRTSLPESQLSEEFRSHLTRRLSERMPAEDIEQAFMDRIRERAGLTPDFFAEENIETSAGQVIQNYIQGHPQLSALTYEDAVAIAQDTMDEGEFERKYGGVDDTVMSNAVLLLLMLNKDRVETEQPDLNTRLQSMGGIQELGLLSMVGTYEDEEFSAWEEQKRGQIAAAITNNHGLMRDIAALKPLLDCTDERDFLRQHRLRVSITEDMTNIYRRVYDVPTLTNQNVMTVYSPLERSDTDNLMGHAGGVPGMTRDDFAIIRSSLFQEVLEADPRTSDQDITASYLQNVTEELRHRVDLHNADRLLNGQMETDDPSYRHTNLFFLNKFFYADSGPSYDLQYLERTAKESAEDITRQVIASLPEQSVPGEASPTPAQPVTPGTRP